MHIAFGPEPVTEGGRRCSHSTNLLGFLFLCVFFVAVVFAPFLIISSHFSVSLYSRHPLDHFPQVMPSSDLNALLQMLRQLVSVPFESRL